MEKLIICIRGKLESLPFSDEKMKNEIIFCCGVNGVCATVEENVKNDVIYTAASEFRCVGCRIQCIKLKIVVVKVGVT